MLRLETLLGSCASACLLAALSYAAPQDKATDTVALVSGTTVSGTIESEEWAGLSLKEKGSSRLIPWAEIASTTYAEAPEELESAVSAAVGGRIEEARAGFAGLAETDLRPLDRQRMLFHAGWAELRAGATDAGVGHLRDLLEAYPSGRYLRAATESAAFALLTKGDGAGAAALLDQATQAAKDPGPQAEIAVVRGHLLEVQGKTDEARAQFEAAEKAADTSEAVRMEAKLGVARAAALGGDRAAAEPVFRELTKASAPPHVLAAAWNGLGDLLSEEGRSKKSIDLVVEGAYGYLRGVVQYTPEIGEPTIEHERALAGASRCFKYISELEQNADRKKVYADRSKSLADELRSTYPASGFLPKAG
jgi:tetratricopeptide (TPR) repeat protein